MKFIRMTAAVLAVMCVNVSVFAQETIQNKQAAQAEIKKVEYSKEYQVFEQLAGYASELYINDEITSDEIMKQGISSMLETNPDTLVPLLKSTIGSLDPYSEYFTAKEFEQYTNNLNKAFYGIGVIIQKNSEYIEIMGFTQDSPAESQGIKIGDKIAKVNGETMRGKNINDVRNAIMGELGTSVTITMLRGSEELEFSVTRSMVKQTTVECDKIDDRIAYISISDMAMSTAQEFEEALVQVDEWGIKNIILDLRNNGGGYLTSAIDIAKMIVPKGLIVKTVYRNLIYNKDFYSELENSKYNFKILVNENTASAAEVLASAMQESGAASIIGEKTYGKAVIQQAYKLTNGSVLKLTVGHYITRNGNEINDEGIRPDEKVKNIAAPIDTTKYTAFDYKTKWNITEQGEGIKAAKERLYLLGYFSGAIDNNFDDLLFDAIMEFQEKNELYPYGVLDISTQVKIENSFAKLEVLDDLQYKHAVKAFGGTVEE